MEGLNTDTIAVLNRLIQTCEDGDANFRKASEVVANDLLKSLFMEIAEEKAFMVTDLQGEITSLGGEPNVGGSIAGAFQRGWLNVKAAFSNGDEHEVLEECRGAEDAAMRSYQEALTYSLPPLTRTLLQRHYEQVVETNRRLRTLEIATS
jgi:uncharacterized protein (TIGR02284 family)